VVYFQFVNDWQYIPVNQQCQMTGTKQLAHFLERGFILSLPNRNK